MTNDQNRNRVRQFRQRQAERGRVRVELYLPEEMAAGVATFASENQESLSGALRKLIEIGLRIECLLLPSRHFWCYIRMRAKNYR